MSRYEDNQKTNQHLGLYPSSAISTFANHYEYNSHIQITDDSGKPFFKSQNNDLKSIGKTLHNLLQEYNLALIDKGYAIRRGELRKLDIIDLRQVLTYNQKPYQQQTNKHMLPDLLTASYRLDKVLLDSWYHLIPCFHHGVIQLNDARYIQYEILKIDTIANTLDIRIKDYARIDDIWQIGVQTTIHYDCHIMTLNTNPLVETKNAIYEMLGIDLSEDNTKDMEFLTNSIINWFITKYATNTDTITYADIYHLIPLSEFRWTDSQKKSWENLVVHYAENNIERLKQSDTSPAKELTKIFTYAVLLSNKLLQDYKPKAVRNSNPQTKRTVIADKSSEQPHKLVRTIGPIKMTSIKPPKLPSEETVVKYKTAVWKSRGGVRRLKNGKLVPFKESIKHRKCLQDVTKDTPQSIIKLK